MKFSMKSITLPFLIILLLSATSLHDQTLKAGTALRVITPAKLIPISGGMGTPEMPTGFKGDLFVRAVVLEQGETRVAIVSIDNLGWPAALADRSKSLILNIPQENILIGATHTHSAPDAYAFPDEKGRIAADLDYLDWCVVQVADAVNEAFDRRIPVHLKSAVGEARGKIAYNYYGDKLFDPRCGVIQAIAAGGNQAGKPVFTLVNYAIHPEILGTKSKLVSPDLCGPMYERIEANGGGMAIFMNGALGGMITADNRTEGGGEANTWEECIRIGHLLADESLRIISTAPVQEHPHLHYDTRMISFPIDSEIMRQVFSLSPVLSKTSGSNDFTTAPARISLLNIGEVQAITIPGEALPNIGFYLKRKMKTSQPFLFGLTHDSFGYIITKEDFDSFERYKYITRTSLGEMTGEIFTSEILKLVGDNPGAGR